MIHLTIPAPRSSHAREDRAVTVQHILDAMGGRPVAKQRWRVEFVLRGCWDSAAGRPLEKNTDRVVQVLLDAMAEAFGYGTKGRGDNWLDRDYTVKAIHEPGEEIAEITLTPL